MDCSASSISPALNNHVPPEHHPPPRAGRRGGHGGWDYVRQAGQRLPARAHESRADLGNVGHHFQTPGTLGGAPFTVNIGPPVGNAAGGGYLIMNKLASTALFSNTACYGRGAPATTK